MTRNSPARFDGSVSIPRAAGRVVRGIAVQRGANGDSRADDRDGTRGGRRGASPREADRGRRGGRRSRRHRGGDGESGSGSRSGQGATDAAGTRDRVVCYYASWAGADFAPSDIPFEGLTSLNYAFLEPRDDGAVVLDSADPAHVEAVAAHGDGETDLRLSISGGRYPETYSGAAATAASRGRFASTAVDHVLEFGYDGIDLDWEYPDGTTDGDDPRNFELLVRAVREELDARVGPGASLTIAASPDPGVADAAYPDGVFEHLDHVHVMTYDYHGGHSECTNFNAPLYSGPDDPSGPDWNVSSTMAYWSGRPPADDDLLVGVPFYGRVFEAVHPGENDGLYRAFGAAEPTTYGTTTDEFEPDPGYEHFWHDDAMVPWLYDSDEASFVTYDDPNSVARKVAFVRERGYGGAFCWELSQDPSGALLAAMRDGLR